MEMLPGYVQDLYHNVKEVHFERFSFSIETDWRGAYEAMDGE